MENQKSLILSLSTYILAFILVVSCTPKEDFCRKDNVKKSRIVVPQLDSLFKAEDKPKIISQYLTLIGYENLANIPDVIDSLQYLKYLGYKSSESCVLELSALEFMNSEKYSSSESVIKSFVPILTISYTGKITKISGRIKISKRGTSLSQIELDSMIDIKKVNALRKSYDRRLAKYNSEMEKINKKREAESKRQYQVNIQKQEKEKQKEAQRKKEEFQAKYDNAPSASALYKYYLDNEIKGNDAFTNKVIYLKGNVSRVTSEGGVATIYLRDDEYTNYVVVLSNDKNSASKLNEGSSIFIRGKCIGLGAAKLFLTIENSEILWFN